MDVPPRGPKMPPTSPQEPQMRQDPLNTPFEVWCTKIAPKLKNIQNCRKKTGIFLTFLLQF